jgi:hypothetical protein
VDGWKLGMEDGCFVVTINRIFHTYVFPYYRLIGCEQVIADIPLRNTLHHCDTNALATPLNKSRSRDKLANMALRCVCVLGGLGICWECKLEECF